jgi:CheY-like chemotaxis protein
METYCPSCGLNVLAVADDSAGARVWRCSACSLILKDEGPSPGAMAELKLGRIALTRMSASEALAKKAAAAPRREVRRTLLPDESQGIELPDVGSEEMVIQSFADDPEAAAGSAHAEVEIPIEPSFPPTPVFEQVLVAEDSALLREVIKDSLAEAGISRAVRSCGNGEEFLQAMAEGIGQQRVPDLAILDVGMPVLNGYYAAIALRAVERGLKVPPTPIVYFTARACDETFKKVLEYTQPARYLNKGADAAPPRIAARLVQVLASLRR